MDEHRIGLKPPVRRVWAPIGQRPVAVVEHRFRWRYLVGFVHPASGHGLAHLASGVSIPLMKTELAAFAQMVGAGPRKQIVLVLDQGASIPVSGCGYPSTSICCFCRPTRPNCSQPNICGL